MKYNSCNPVKQAWSDTKVHYRSTPHMVIHTAVLDTGQQWVLKGGKLQPSAALMKMASYWPTNLMKGRKTAALM